ncbi:MAG: peptide deformylase [Ruminococcaceae bacterium]|nr:peptide deformylase [Oscillospiraceae bacterium]
MAILTIVKEGDDILRKKSRPVEEITPRIITLLNDMYETLTDVGGAGLAAVQVGVLRRLFIVIDEDGKLYELINPEIVSAEGKQEEMEGCLSLPGKWGYTERPAKVTIRGLDRNGVMQTYTGEGLLARAFCHENDHLDGIIYTDKATHMLTQEELEELEAEQNREERRARRLRKHGRND